MDWGLTAVLCITGAQAVQAGLHFSRLSSCGGMRHFSNKKGVFVKTPSFFTYSLSGIDL